ncbi:HypC/HybG/HupF family hydrogenase formation chaperone [Actinomadura sp. 6K520]|uniref:HypC/HybG/HupF family hydrogenase formation chaperone n=1 Tax=Actinomadura sp. 6K520 TaxID=2530364 RepID=UPI0010527DD2|nr:HypC/HybG/HupF family hydrogenase formation chaperone [Actinomadura sp. 6K520]TDE24952.1 hydrogenase assembly protein HupF [Actinomadura sp. 6K520]
MTASEAGGNCAGDHCVTCSDEAVPVRILRVGDDGLAEVDTGDGRVEQVSVALVDAVAGDTVLVHAKEAIGVVS